MDPRTINFIVFALVSVLSLAAGHDARRRGWLDESWSRRIHFHTVVWVWSLTSVLALWRLKLSAEQLWIVALNPPVLLIGAGAAVLLARVLKLSRGATGVLAIAGGVTNSGVTLGSYICYSVLHPPEQALAYSIAWVSVMQVCGMLMLYPVAEHFGGAAAEGRSVRELVFATLIDLRSLPLLGAVAGLALSMLDVPDGGVIERFHVLHVLFYVGGAASYFGIGMRLHLGRSFRTYWREHAIVAAVHFALLPLATAAMLWAIHASPYPLGGLGTHVVFISNAMPAAIMTVMVANLFHLDARLAGAVWLWNTILFAVGPLPLLLWFYA